MTVETITKILYVWTILSLCFPFIMLFQYIKIRRCKDKLKRQDYITRHYEEMLYAAKDGYFTDSLYKNKSYQFCSRRLATLLNLKNGENSKIDEVLNQFIKEDKDKLHLHYHTLKENGVAFETLAQTQNGKTFNVTGVRINSMDMQINSNCLWFRDLTPSTDFIKRVTEEAYSCRKQLEDFRILIDNLPFPIWLRDDKLHITLLNRRYLKLLGLNDFKELTDKNSTLHDLGNATDLLALARTAQESNTPQKKQINILSEGDLRKYEIAEIPYHDSSLKTSHTVGSLIDITEFEEAKRNYRVHLDSHLDILSSLDTAFCIINTKHNFTFANSAFLKLWNLPENFLDSAQHYNAFLDKIREMKVLPEVSDFKAYKEEENKAFDELTEQREDLLYIPDGRTFRRLRAPHPDGTIIAYEDISESLEAARKLSDAVAVQQGILNNLSDALIIFSPNLKLSYYNPSFTKLWDIKAQSLDTAPSLQEVLDMQQSLLPELENWQTFREDMQKHITASTPFTLKLKNKQTLKVSSFILADTSLMITYHKE